MRRRATSSRTNCTKSSSRLVIADFSTTGAGCSPGQAACRVGRSMSRRVPQAAIQSCSRCLASAKSRCQPIEAEPCYFGSYALSQCWRNADSSQVSSGCRCHSGGMTPTLSP